MGQDPSSPIPVWVPQVFQVLFTVTGYLSWHDCRHQRVCRIIVESMIQTVLNCPTCPDCHSSNWQSSECPKRSACRSPSCPACEENTGSDLVQGHLSVGLCRCFHSEPPKKQQSLQENPTGRPHRKTLHRPLMSVQ